MLRSAEYANLSEASVVYIMVNCKDGTEQAIFNELRETIYVNEVLGTHGSYDIIAKIVSPTLEGLLDTIRKIRKIKGIRCTTTLICLNI